MLSLKMKMESSRSQKWLGPMIPQSRDLTNGDGEGRPGRLAVSLRRAPRSSPGSADQFQPGPGRWKVDLSSCRWLTFRFMYIIDISTVRSTVTPSLSDFLKYLLSLCKERLKTTLNFAGSAFLHWEEISILKPFLWGCNWQFTGYTTKRPTIKKL